MDRANKNFFNTFKNKLASIFKSNLDPQKKFGKKTLKLGGALAFKGSHLFIDDCYAEKNTGLKGGFISLDSYDSKTQSIILKSSILKGNEAAHGGVLGISRLVSKIDILIQKNYFTANRAISITTIVIIIKT